MVNVDVYEILGANGLKLKPWSYLDKTTNMGMYSDN